MRNVHEPAPPASAPPEGAALPALPFLPGRPPSPFTTRFAPAPTGYLHLGHVASAMAVWGVARAFGGRVLLRIEDHDRARCRKEFETAILEDLEWLGFQPDEGAVRQSERQATYEAALRGLEERGLVYACRCSRKSIQAAFGPASGEIPYRGVCRAACVDGRVEKGRRVILEPAEIRFVDLRLGAVTHVPSEQTGDILIRDRNGNWTYQFAVAVDDFEQGVDLVIRGEDLFPSTGRQIQLAQLLGRKTAPSFLHHPLITHPGGEKLSKSNRDTGVRDLRKAGWSAERMFGQAGRALGVSLGEPISMTQMVEQISSNAQREPASPDS